jgi:hypothetical protein
MVPRLKDPLFEPNAWLEMSRIEGHELVAKFFDEVAFLLYFLIQRLRGKLVP